MAQQVSGRSGLVVSGLGAPGSGQGGHSALGTNFNGRNSSGLLYMHHGSLNNLAQTVNTGASNGGTASQNGPILQGPALPSSSMQAKSSQNRQALQKMYQT